MSAASLTRYMSLFCVVHSGMSQLMASTSNSPRMKPDLHSQLDVQVGSWDSQWHKIWGGAYSMDVYIARVHNIHMACVHPGRYKFVQNIFMSAVIFSLSGYEPASMIVSITLISIVQT